MIEVETVDTDGNKRSLEDMLNTVRALAILRSSQELKSEVKMAKALGVSRGTLRKYRKLLGV